MQPLLRPLLLTLLLSGSMLTLSGCIVVAVVDTAASLAVGAVGLVGDAAIGTVKVAGKVVGATADAILPSGK
jgi:dolichol kinase